MASETTPKTIQQDTNVGASLPFSDLDELKFGHVISGPRISLRRYKASYGSITIRSFSMNGLPNRGLNVLSGNYLAGHTKKSLSLGAKHVSDLKAFVDLPVELQILVRTTRKPFDIVITHW